MNIDKYISESIKTRTIQNFIAGFEKSEFVSDDIDPYTFMKNVIDAIMNNSYKSVNKKQSYCAEFNHMMTNVIGLIGMEFVMYLMIWNDLKKILEQLVGNIKRVTSAPELKEIVQIIENIIVSKCDNIDRVNIDNTVIVSALKTLGFGSVASHKSDGISFSSIISDNRTELFECINKYITVKSQNIPKTRDVISNVLTKIINSMTFNNIEIKTINQLCVNTSILNTPYKGSFIKLFEIMHQETFIDIPKLEEQNDEQQGYAIPNPTIMYLKSLDVSEKKFLKSVKTYFRLIITKFQKIFTTMIVSPSAELMELMSQIVLTLCTAISKQIANQQISYYTFGKITRIQGFQVMTAITNVIPKVVDLTQSQKEVLHYALLTSKNLSLAYEKHIETMNNISSSS
jgi:hypothetical protein